MNQPADPEIEALVTAFYAAFDNRSGRVPDGRRLREMFDEAATITRASRDGVETWDPQAFIAPRLAMLTDGGLTEFHEWEVEARTVVRENIAARWSTYA